MMTKRTLLIILLAIVGMAATIPSSGKKAGNSYGKAAAMIFDATANFARFNDADSIDYYLKKIRNLGFTHAVVDIRPISGEVLYDSRIAPKLKEWKGAECGDFDYLGRFIKTGHKLGLKIIAQLNIFCAGHNYYDRGVVYSEHPEWASLVYDPQRGIIPISEQKEKYGCMVNPANDEYQEYIISILKEVVKLYPTLDGIMLDRARYDGMTSDFSEISRRKFEEYIGHQIAFPANIMSWECAGPGDYRPVCGPMFNKWIEWRAKTIHDFMLKAKAEVKSVRKDILFGVYTGAWYPSYYEVGVNFASKSFDPSSNNDWWWATPNYKDYGIAEIMDFHMVGNYYKDITIDEYLAAKRIVRNETDMSGSESIWYNMEGSCKNLRKILGDNEFWGGILASEFYDCPSNLSRAISENIKDSDGLMIFDIVHIIEHGMWDEVTKGLK